MSVVLCKEFALSVEGKMTKSLDKLFYEVFLLSDHAVFIEELWAKEISESYIGDLRQHSKAKNFIELDSANLLVEEFIFVLGNSADLIDEDSSYRRAIDFLEKVPIGVLVFRQTHMMSVSVLHLVSRMIRYAERKGLRWKFVFFGIGIETNPLRMDQLYISKFYPTEARRSSAPPAVAKKKKSSKQKKALAVVLPIALLGGLGLFFFKSNHGTYESNNIPTMQTEIPVSPEPFSNDTSSEADNTAGIDKQNLSPNEVLLETINESRLRDLEFEKTLARINAQENYSVEDQSLVRDTRAGQERPSLESWRTTISLELPPEAEAAIRNNDLAIVKSLLISKKLRESKNQDGQSPLVIATNAGRQRILNWLIEQNVEVNSRDQFGRTALYYAAINGDDSLIKSIISAGGKVNVNSKLAKTPLMAAVNNNHFSTARFLIERGSNINAVDHSGWPAVFYAAWNTNIKMLNLLIDNGAQLDVKDDNGVSIKEIAEAKGATEILGLLEK